MAEDGDVLGHEGDGLFGEVEGVVFPSAGEDVFEVVGDSCFVGEDVGAGLGVEGGGLSVDEEDAFLHGVAG